MSEKKGSVKEFFCYWGEGTSESEEGAISDFQDRLGAGKYELESWVILQQKLKPTQSKLNNVFAELEDNVDMKHTMLSSTNYREKKYFYRRESDLPNPCTGSHNKSTRS